MRLVFPLLINIVLAPVAFAGRDAPPDFPALIRDLDKPEERCLRKQLDVAHVYFIENRDALDDYARPWFAALIKEMSRLADQGDAEWQWRLGAEYLRGGLVPHDDAKALALYVKAARQDFPEAYVAIGNYYKHADGLARSIQFMRVGAMLGSGEACYEMAFLYGPNCLMKENWTEEYAWSLLAQRRGLALRKSAFSRKPMVLDSDGQARAQNIELELDRLRFSMNWQQCLEDVKPVD